VIIEEQSYCVLIRSTYKEVAYGKRYASVVTCVKTWEYLKISRFAMKTGGEQSDSQARGLGEAVSGTV
jgi:hypothetical protein